MAALQVHARDACPLLDVAAAEGSLPHVVTEALTLPNLQGQTQVHFDHGTLTLSPLRVTSGKNEMVGTASIGKVTTATMLARSGPLAVGLGVAVGKVTVDLLHGQEMLARALQQAKDR